MEQYLSPGLVISLIVVAIGIFIIAKGLVIVATGPECDHHNREPAAARGQLYSIFASEWDRPSYGEVDA